MAYFPFFMELEGVSCLVAGGGTVALRKIEALLAFGAKITVTAPEIMEKITEIREIKIKRREFEESDLLGKTVVIAASDNRLLNHRIALLAKERGILVNAADQKEDCGFLFPAFIKQKDVIIGITSGGGSPLLSKHVKEALESSMPAYLGILNEQLSKLRPAVKKRITEEAARREFWKELEELGWGREGILPEEAIEKLFGRYGDR